MKQKRKAYTTTDIRDIRRYYTSGLLQGREMAVLIGHGYSSFRTFIARHPELSKKRRKAATVEEC